MRVVAVSPHLDDAAFSAGGVLALLTDAGHHVRVITCFTGSVASADCSEFALSTQLDKGLPADVDYMALRRDEDLAALAVLGAEPLHLPLREAPHRGYTSPADLFAGRHPGDDVAGALVPALLGELADADLVLAPQAVGDHVDHQVVAAAIGALADGGALRRERVAWWRDAPYALRHPDAAGAPEVAGDEVVVGIGGVLERRVAAARSYVTQVGFQFGGTAQVAGALGRLARDEGARHGVDSAVEVLRAGRDATSILTTVAGHAGRVGD